MLKNEIAIIIPIIDDFSFLNKCLNALKTNLAMSTKIIVAGGLDCDSEGVKAIIDSVESESVSYFQCKKAKTFATACNEALKYGVDADADILIVDQRTEVTSNFLEEMHSTLYANDKHAIVCPRSDRTELFSVPFFQDDFIEKKLNKDFIFGEWQKLKSSLPPYYVVPMVQPFCMLIRRSVINNFGFLDENILNSSDSVNDFFARINKFGYSAVVSNNSFVFYDESGPILSQDQKIIKLHGESSIMEKYPEHGLAVDAYFDNKIDPIDFFSDVIFDFHEKKKILFSLYNLFPVYNGTAEFGIALLNSFYDLFGDKYEIGVLTRKDGWEFHKENFHKTIKVHFIEDEISSIGHYHIAISLAQILNVKQLCILNKITPKIIVATLDAIAYRTNHLDTGLSFGNAHFLSRFSLSYCDGFLAISENTKKDVLGYYYNTNIENVAIKIIYPGSGFKFKNNGLQGHDHKSIYDSIFDSKYILLIGNDFAHKSIKEAVIALNGTSVKKVVIGIENIDEKYNKDEFVFVKSGSIPDNVMTKLYSEAHLIVFPSQYEGFGLPIFKALEFRKKIILFDNDLNRELISRFIIQDKQAFLFDKFSSLAELVEQNLFEYDLLPSKLRSWNDAAMETEMLIDEVLEKEIDVNKIRLRWFLFNFIYKQVAKLEEELGKASNIIKYNENLIKEKDETIQEKNKLIATMENSIFWKIRKAYLKIKRIFIEFLQPSFFKKIIFEIIRLLKKTLVVFKSSGCSGVFQETKNYFNKLSFGEKKAVNNLKDCLFVSGCYIEAPHRYRCIFQKEQLEKNGFSSDIILYEDIKREMVKYYDVIILYRAPITKEIEEFVSYAKRLNKMVIFDVDDIVFDDELPKKKGEVQNMSEAERNLYFDGVRRMRETMQICDYGIASTAAIKTEMEKYIKNVVVNRNSVGDDLIKMSDTAYNGEGITKNDKEVILAYFSGSNTHSEDFEMIEDSVIKIFKKHGNVRLLIVGPMELSNKFDLFKDRITRKAFVPWNKLPELINEIDINLAPLVLNEFNNGKSEIKFTEAALLRKPTVASNADSFVYAIKNGKTGFIANTEDEWFNFIEKLVDNKSLREEIGKAACADVIERYNTKKTGENLISFIDTNRKKKILYISPSTNISGGVMVICQHLKLLQQRGFNVLVVSMDEKEKINWMHDFDVPIVSVTSFAHAKLGLLDFAVATLWSTVKMVEHSDAKRKYYLVQSKENLFYDVTDPRYKLAEATYSMNIKYITVSKWCQQWLLEEFGQNSTYIPNGIDAEIFKKTSLIEEKKHNKTRILIEGNPADDVKNIDEAFKIVNLLERSAYEVWFISYGATPKSWYKYDKYFQKIPFKEMSKYYSSCDILLKTSKMESFSYPPLEMMACGGVCVVAENCGNVEYIKNEVNALTYELGDIEKACNQINRLAKDEKLRNILIKNGMETVKNRSWENSIDILEEIYEK